MTKDPQKLKELAASIRERVANVRKLRVKQEEMLRQLEVHAEIMEHGYRAEDVASFDRGAIPRPGSSRLAAGVGRITAIHLKSGETIVFGKDHKQ